MQRDLNAILTYVAQLQVSLIPPASNPWPRSATSSTSTPTPPAPPSRQDILRPADVFPGADRKAIMTAQPLETDGRFFKVPKVIER